MTEDYSKYYFLEKYLEDEVNINFHRNKVLTTKEFFSIVIWKSNRPKKQIAASIAKNANGNLTEGVKFLTNQLYTATNHETRMGILLDLDGIGLPMASAILTILYPNDFTIYDYRVAGELYKKVEKKPVDLTNIGDKQNRWKAYLQFVKDVRNWEGSESQSLRTKDQCLWGKSFHDQLEEDLESMFNGKRLDI
ncbi:MAG: hypothetical protein Q8S11_14800 [Daejeonella sp.]|uniref:hypothetical protein n=1 Tax=Daejeonella sp. TaxID=2805397 RepID=UPI00273320F1|nr:hypothetical protein [Daejeonella sp.]MDP3469606.1 hypothetical protein [Daejeonella sp.]